ncbi:MAG: hypothetical protein KatS3mg043_1866 [Rhodothermaceae bacterium]|nr:MAG: hypothetical protein KatS3mg043_1866 [Rhodothermaceae bacterium]
MLTTLLHYLFLMLLLTFAARLLHVHRPDRHP